MSELFNLLYWRDVNVLVFIFVPILFVLFNRIRQHWQWNKLADPQLQPWLKIQPKSSKSLSSIALLTAAWLCFVIALAGPRLVDWLPPEQQAEPATLIIVLDLSASMNAEDAYPSRKDQAIQWLTKSIKSKPNHLKIGIVLFSGHAFNLMPATLDKNIIKYFIAQLDKLTLPTLGNDLSSALSLAKQQFKENNREQIIAILTDGDLSKPEQQRAQLLIKNTLKKQTIALIGFGGKKAVKLPKASGGFVLFNGRPVQSRLQTTWLRQLERLDHVSYQHYEQIKQQNLQKAIHLKTTRLNLKAQKQVIWHELFPYPLILAMLLFVLSLWRMNPTNKVLKTPLQVFVCCFIIATISSYSPTSQANETDSIQQANKALKNHNYKLAQGLFNKDKSAIGAFGEGIACYRQNNFKCAARAFSKAAWQTKKSSVKASAVFNLANSYFFLGEYDQASVLFKDAKNLGFKPKVAQRNLEFSNVMQQAVLQRIKDIKETYRRAKWRAAIAGNPSPSLESFISNQSNLASTTKDKTQNYLIRQAMAQQINQKLGFQQANNNSANHWIKTEHAADQSTAQLINRLLEMELGIPARLKEPQAIKGKRQW